MTRRAIRIANCSGFLGDRQSAAAEMVHGGPIDVLTGDYLAELTMAILAGQRLKDSAAGFARPFLTQLEEVLGVILDRGIKVVVNAGGLNPDGLGAEVEALAARLGRELVVGVVGGDDLLSRLGDIGDGWPHQIHGRRLADRGLHALTANAYLGGWGITAALDHGADIVVTGRVSDASLALGPAAWWHGWERDDWDTLAGAIVAGHLIECGAQVTGGNYAFFADVPGLAKPGFPIAEIAADGSSSITKHEGTGGIVTVGTVTAQLLYEVGSPQYLNPDVTAMLDSVVLAQSAPDVVSVSGVRGAPPPPTTKVGIVGLEGFRNQVTFILTGLDIEAKAALALEGLWELAGPAHRYAEVDVRLVRTDQPDPSANEAAWATLTVTVTDPDADLVGRAFSNAAVQLALASYPGFTLSAPPGSARPATVFWPSVVAQSEVPSHVRVGGAESVVPATLAAGVESVTAVPPGVDGGRRWVGEPMVRVPLGRVAGARSGDKGGDANVGLWVASDVAYSWLVWFLTEARFRELIPEAATLGVSRYLLPNVLGMNFVVAGFLGEGVASSTRSDPQAKTLGEYLRARVVAVPEELLAV